MDAGCERPAVADAEAGTAPWWTSRLPPRPVWRASAWSVTLRLLVAGSRFVLFIVLARFLSVEEVGLFGLVQGGINFALFALGLEFYQYTARELIRCDDPDGRARLLRDQGVVHASAAATLIPLSLLAFAAGVLPWHVAPWFYVLMIAEHACFELRRALIALSRPVVANVIVFLHNGGWVYALAAVFWWAPGLRALDAVWWLWGTGCALAVGAGARALRNLGWSRVRAARIDWAWIRRGIRVALPFLGATLALRGIVTVDRFFIDRFWGHGGVGVYAFFFGITNFIPVLVDTGVSAVLFPRLVAAYQRRDYPQYSRMLRQLAAGTLGLALVLAALLALVIGPVLRVIARPSYAEALPTFWMLLAAATAAAAGTIAHYPLYVRNADWAIIVPAVVGFAVAVAGHVALVPSWGPLGAATATLLAMLVVAGGKGAALLYVRGRERQPNDR